MRGVDIADRHVEQRLGIGHHAVAPLARVLRAPACRRGCQETVEALPEGRGVQFRRTRGHALGIAVGQRIDPGGQQLAGFIGLGAGLGEADDARRAEPHRPARGVDLEPKQPRLGDAALGPVGVACSIKPPPS